MVSHPELKVLEQTSEYSIATFGPILLQLWQNSTPLAGARSARKHARELAQAGYAQTGSLVIVPIGSSMPAQDARAELTSIPIELSNGKGIVLVQEGTGFRASAIRAVLSTTMLLSRRLMPHDVVPNAEAGCLWLSKRVSIPGGAAALAAATSRLRSLLQ